MMDCHKVCAVDKGTLDLEFNERGDDRGEDVSAPEHLTTDLHEVGDGVIAIADELQLLA